MYVYRAFEEINKKKQKKNHQHQKDFYTHILYTRFAYIFGCSGLPLLMQR